MFKKKQYVAWLLSLLMLVLGGAPMTFAQTIKTEGMVQMATSVEWKVGTYYQKGDIVNYQGISYECRQTHQSLQGWEPAHVAALWMVTEGGGGPVDPPQPPDKEEIAAPTGLKATAKRTDTIVVNWQEVTGATGYELEVDGRVIQVEVPSYEHTGLQANSTHTYKVRVFPEKQDAKYLWSSAVNEKTLLEEGPVDPTQPPVWQVNKAYNGGERVSYKSEVYEAKWWTQGEAPDKNSEWGAWKYIGGSVEPPKGDVAAPKGLKVEAKSPNEITVSWESVANVTDYEIEVDGKVIQLKGTIYEHTGLLPESTHNYKVRVTPVDPTLTYLWSDLVSGKTLGEEVPPIGEVEAPKGLKVEAKSPNEITVSWESVANVTDYEIEVDGKIIQLKGTIYEHTGLLPESTHNYKVRVTPVDTTINYLWSTIVSGKTLAEEIPPVVDKDAPKPATLSNNQWGGDYDGSYDLTWHMYYGPNAQQWELYEKYGRLGTYQLIDTGALTSNTPLAQNGVIEIRGKEKPGTYLYQLKLINTAGSSISNECAVTVGAPNDEKTLIVGVDDEGVKNQFTINQNTYSYPLENIVAETKAQFEVVTNNPSVISVSIEAGNKLKVTGVGAGRASIKITEKQTGNVRYVGCRVKEANGTLPGMPDYVAVGSVSEDTTSDLSFWRDFDGDLNTNKRMDIRYIYINGGPLQNGWKDWTSVEGDRARTYVKESLKLGMIPFFVYYNIPDSAEDYGTDLAHIQSDTYMKAYFENLKYLLDICKQEAGDELVGMVLEPDFLGYMMQQSGVQPNEIMAKTSMAYTSGVLDAATDPKFENTVEGLVKAINYTINKHYPDAYYGWQFNIWSYAGNGDVPGQGLLHKTEYVGHDEGIAFIKEAARITAEYYKAAGVATYGADFISIDKYGLDGAYEAGAAENPKESKWLWNADLWNNYLEYASVLGKTCDLPVVLWQIPVGRLNQSQQSNPYGGGLFPALTNAVGNYEDSAPTFFFGDAFKPGSQTRLDYFGTNVWNDRDVKISGDTITWDSHMDACRDKGIIAVLFGAGVGASTDSVGSPPADHYWWITKAQEYFKNPALLK